MPLSMRHNRAGPISPGPDHLRAIYDAKGTVVPNLGNIRYGRRARDARRGMEKKSGGSRPREAKAIACHALHVDAQGAEKKRFERMQSGAPQEHRSIGVFEACEGHIKGCSTILGPK